MASSFAKKGCLFFVIAGALVLAVALVGTLWLDRQYAFLWAAPRVPHEQVFTMHPSIRATADPVKLRSLVLATVEDQFPSSPPAWLIDLVLPYAVFVAFAADHQGMKTPVQLFVNDRRLGPVIAEQFNLAGVTERFPRIQWSHEGMVRARAGVLTLEGAVPMDAKAQADALLEWNPGLKRSPLEFLGGHLFEAVADNRDGGAFVVMASLMKAYDFDLDREVEDVSLTTFLFVISARLTIDLRADDAFVMHLEIEVVPEAKDRIAVINLKAALDRGLESLTERLREDHDIVMTGASGWDANVMKFDYVLPRASKVFVPALKGELFPLRGPAR